MSLLAPSSLIVNAHVVTKGEDVPGTKDADLGNLYR